jgi:hypothetical protein
MCYQAFMFRRLFVPAVVALGLASHSAEARPKNRATVPASAECCRVCHKGKACGDACITRSKSCELPKGCACDEAKGR